MSVEWRRPSSLPGLWGRGRARMWVTPASQRESPRDERVFSLERFPKSMFPLLSYILNQHDLQALCPNATQKFQGSSQGTFPRKTHTRVFHPRCHFLSWNALTPIWLFISMFRDHIFVNTFRDHHAYKSKTNQSTYHMRCDLTIT